MPDPPQNVMMILYESLQNMIISVPQNEQVNCTIMIIVLILKSHHKFTTIQTAILNGMITGVF